MTSHFRARMLGVLTAVAMFEVVPLAHAAITYAIESDLAGEVHLVVSDAGTASLANPAVVANDASVTIRWGDGEPTWAWIYYAAPEELAGKHPAPASGTVRTDGSFSASHEVTIDGLVPGVEYRYLIETTDGDANVSSSEIASFRAR